METDGSFKQFSMRRALWIRCLDGDDRNTVFKQIYQLIWNTGVFRVINEARKAAPPAKEGGVQLNGMIHRFMDQCFFESQLLAIRRLTDTYPIDGDNRGRDVFSLRALLRDMRQHVGLLTRGNIFRAEELEYDHEAVQQRFEAFSAERARSGESTFAVSRELDSFHLLRRHEQLDSLTGIGKERRTPADQIQPAVLDFLEQKIRAMSDTFKTHVDKFIAHAATPESRQAVSADTVSITLGQMWEAQSVICQVANFVDTYLLGRGIHMGFLPTPQFDIFSYLDRPLIGEADPTRLGEVWSSYGKETSTWSQWGLEAFRSEFEEKRQDAKDFTDPTGEVRA